MCVYEKMRIDFFFLIKEHKALKNNCLSLQHFTLHTKAQPPLPQEAERRFAQDNTTAPFLTSPSQPLLKPFSSLKNGVPHLFWRRKSLQPYLPFK